MQTLEQTPSSSGMGEEAQNKVRAQLDRLLESHQFRNSRRYPALLRFIVEETLEGRGDFLKERLIGIHVFGRPANYDTANDPIVRVTIAEVRKRIAQYYHDEEHDAEIRIELLTGRYAPEFRPRREARPEEHATAAPLSAVPLSEHEPTPQAVVATTPLVAAAEPEVAPPVAAAGSSHWLHARRTRFAAVLSLVLFFALGSWAALHWLRPSSIDEFWAPVLASRQPVLFCLPTEVSRHNVAFAPPEDGIPGRQKTTGPTFYDHESLGENVVYSDMLATLHVVNMLALHHIDYHVRLNVNTSLEDLRAGPSVMVGGLDNQWTLRAIDKLPYRFAGSDADSWWIADQKAPLDRRWTLNIQQLYAAVTRDYALVARLHNEQTGEPEVILAGIGMSGTAAAGEMVADEQLMNEARRRIGPGFKNRDFEIVISTDVVNGIAGSPKILAVSSW